jgi:energy-coupling factor transporter ATP-binding protein EcfA2
MEPATIAARLASSAVTPIVRKLFVREAPGAGLVDRPVRISSLVSFKGEQRTLTERDLSKLAEELADRAVQAAGPHEAPDAETRRELAEAVAAALHSMGDLDMDDVQAVQLGPEGLARQLTRPSGLSATAEAYFGPLMHTACLHILNFFSRRSTFIPRTLVEQTRQLDRIITTQDLLLSRVPSLSAEDTRFEQQYAEHIARKHGELTIYGLDLRHAREWRLDSAYISLEATQDTGDRLRTAISLPADRALHGQERVLLRGAAGSGKTTLVQWLAVTAARQTYDEHLTHLIGRVPFVLPLRRVVREGLPPTPDRFLHAARSALAGGQPAGWAHRVLRAGRGLLLIDGIDEIPDEQREEVRRWMRELMGDFPGNLWLVTSRPSAVREDWLAGEEFTELSLSPMARHETAAFVRRWHDAADADPDLADVLLGAMRTNADLGRLAVNPLMCGLLCALHRERHGFLPNSRKDLYDAALAMLLERRDVERSVAVPDSLRLSKETQVQLLQKLAHWMIRNDRAEMEQADAIAQFGRALSQMAHVDASPEEVFRHLLDRSGLLREPAEGRVDFVHRTFQDYLGAKAAVEEGDFPLLLDNAHRDQWEDVIRMAVAHARPAERARLLLGLITETDVDDFGAHFVEETPNGRGLRRLSFHRILLAAACLEQATELDPTVRDEVTRMTAYLLPPQFREIAGMLADRSGSLVLGLLPGPEGLTDREAEFTVVAASRTGLDAALPVLARYRNHPSLDVRRQLVGAWHRFDTDEYAREIVAHLDPKDLYFTAHHIDHLRALRAMGGRSRIQIAREHDPEVLTEHIDAERLTHLWLLAGLPPVGEDWWSAFPNLHKLVLPRPAIVPPHLTVVVARDSLTHG